MAKKFEKLTDVGVIARMYSALSATPQIDIPCYL
jgi:hypothetical protein